MKVFQTLVSKSANRDHGVWYEHIDVEWISQIRVVDSK